MSESEPTSPGQAAYLRGNDCLDRHDLDAAWAAYSEALALDPDNLDARYNRAIVSIQRDAYEAAGVQHIVLALTNPDGDSRHRAMDTLAKLFEITPR